MSQSVSIMYTQNKHPKLNNVTNAYLWYCRLDHINKNRINKLAQESILNINDCESSPICEFYLLRKMIKSPFTEKDKRVNDVLGRIYSDVCGPMSINTRGGYSYFITFIKDLSRYGYVYLMKHKFESFEIFKWFHNEVEKQTEKGIKIFWSDRGGEYLFSIFLTYLGENGILSQWTPSETPQYNGISERRNEPCWT